MTEDHPRIISLKKKHEALDAEITQAEQDPSEDHLQIAELKRQKLAVKDKMAGIL